LPVIQPRSAAVARSTSKSGTVFGFGLLPVCDNRSGTGQTHGHDLCEFRVHTAGLRCCIAVESVSGSWRYCLRCTALEARISKMRGGISTSLDAKLSAELNAVNNQDSSTACNISGAFQNEVDALSGNLISNPGSQQLTFANTRLRTALDCQ